MNQHQNDEEAVTRFVAQICAYDSRRAMADAAEEIYIGTKRQPHNPGSSRFQALMNAGLRSYLSSPREALFSDPRAQDYLHHLHTVRVALKRIGEIPP